MVELCGAPMIVQVWRRAVEAAIGPVLVAADGPEIVAAIVAAGGQAVATDPALPSGSDRIFAALRQFDPERRFDVIVNLQGDLPTIDPASVRASLAPLRTRRWTSPRSRRGFCAPRSGPTPMWSRRWARRLGRHACARFISPARPRPGAKATCSTISASTPIAARRWSISSPCRPRALEKREKLEQLRALEAGMRIDVEIVAAVPLGVDTPQDLERARQILNGQTANDQDHRLSGRTRRQFPHRLFRRLSGLGNPALRQFRGGLRRHHRRAGRTGHDPDREFAGRPRRRHPSFPARCRPAHHRRIFPADPFPSSRPQGRAARRICAASTAMSMRSANAAKSSSATG